VLSESPGFFSFSLPLLSLVLILGGSLFLPTRLYRIEICIGSRNCFRTADCLAYSGLTRSYREGEELEGEFSFFFFLFQLRIFLRVNRCGNAAAGNVCEHQLTQDDRNCSADKSMTFLPNDVEDSKRKWYVGRYIKRHKSLHFCKWPKMKAFIITFTECFSHK